jgi:hypothetical protein
VIDRLRRIVGVPIRVLHYVRDPLDNITTIARRGKLSLPMAIDDYFRFAQGASLGLAGLGADEQLTCYHEDFVADPRAELSRVVRFLGLTADDAFLERCASRVFARPRKTADTVEWTPSCWTRCNVAQASTPGTRATTSAGAEGAPGSASHRYGYKVKQKIVHRSIEPISDSVKWYRV